MSIKRTLLKAGFITVCAGAGIGLGVYTLDKFEESFRKDGNADSLDDNDNEREDVEEKNTDNEDI